MRCLAIRRKGISMIRLWLLIWSKTRAKVRRNRGLIGILGQRNMDLLTLMTRKAIKQGLTIIPHLGLKQKRHRNKNLLPLGLVIWIEILLKLKAIKLEWSQVSLFSSWLPCMLTFRIEIEGLLSPRIHRSQGAKLRLSLGCKARYLPIQILRPFI